MSAPEDRDAEDREVEDPAAAAAARVEQAGRRWRLVLGPAAESTFGRPEGRYARLDQSLGFLDDDDEDSGAGSSQGGSSEGSGLMTSVDWINEVTTLFPKSVAERLIERAMAERGIDDVVLNSEALQKVQPSPALLQAILRSRSLMNPAVLGAARKVVRQVVEELMQRMAVPVRTPFSGVRNPRRRSRVPIAANFDARGTIRANLRNIDPQTGQIIIAEPLFVTRVRRQIDQWQVIVAVDQSGSMGASVIHSAITAAIFHGIDSLRAHLVAFDTEVVDLTGDLADPVEVLMSVQLGGGTDIGKAVRYCAGLVTEPRRTIVVIISDFFEGGDVQGLLQSVSGLVESGSTVLAMAALDMEGRVNVDERTARQLAARGAHVGAMTPDELAQWVAEIVDGARPGGAADPDAEVLGPIGRRTGR